MYVCMSVCMYVSRCCFRLFPSWTAHHAIRCCYFPFSHHLHLWSSYVIDGCYCATLPETPHRRIWQRCQHEFALCTMWLLTTGMSTRVYSPYHMIAVCSSKGVITPVYYVCITVYNIWIYNYIMNMLCMYVCIYIYIMGSTGGNGSTPRPRDRIGHCFALPCGSWPKNQMGGEPKPQGISRLDEVFWFVFIHFNLLRMIFLVSQWEIPYLGNP